MKFLLLVFPEGKSIITTRQDLSSDEIQKVSDAFEVWQKGPPGTFLIGTGVDVVFSQEIELDLGPERIQRRDRVPSEANQPAAG